MSNQLQLGVQVGLGRMGGDLALQCLDKGIYVVGHSVHAHPDLQAQGVKTTSDYINLIKMLTPPRRRLHLGTRRARRGRSVKRIIAPCRPWRRDPGWRELVAPRFHQSEKGLREKGIYFLQCGTSGGISGARTGACFMVGGPREGFDIAEPMLKKLAVDGGLLYPERRGPATLSSSCIMASSSA